LLAQQISAYQSLREIRKVKEFMPYFMLSKTEFSEYKEGAASLISHGHDNGYMSL
jgi:hypothetical protein